MIRKISGSRCVYTTTSSRPVALSPSVIKRCSSKQSGSSRVSAKSSANAVTASLNATPCFSKFALALARFHSTRIFELYIYLCIFASTESLLFIASLFLPADAGIQPTINHPTVPKIKPRMADRVVNAIYPQRRRRRLQAPIGSRRRTRSTRRARRPASAAVAHCTASKMAFHPGRNSGILPLRDTGTRPCKCTKCDLPPSPRLVVAGLSRGTLGDIKSIGLQQWKHLIVLRLILKQ